jgi:hypothetical protein
MRKFSALAAMILACSIILAAQDALSGKWEGETSNGSAIVLDLTAKGTALTGTLTRNGQSSPLSEGKVSRGSFTFKAQINDQIEGISGELAGDEIKMWLDRQGPERAIVLKRVKRD